MKEFKILYQIGGNKEVFTKYVTALTKAQARQKFKSKFIDNCLILNIEG